MKKERTQVLSKIYFASFLFQPAHLLRVGLATFIKRMCYAGKSLNCEFICFTILRRWKRSEEFFPLETK